MSKQTDYLNKYIKEILLPVVQEDSFHLYKPKHFIRINEPFIDSISFQLSQHGSRSFHVHACKNLLSNPLLNMNSYSVGFRLSDNGDDVKWHGADEEQARQAIESVLNAYRFKISPWFKNVNTIAQYIYEKVSSPQFCDICDFDSAIAFAEGGKRDKAWWISTSLLDSDVQNGFDDNTNDIISLQNRACQQYIDVNELENYSEMNSENTDSKLLEALSQMPTTESEIKSIDELLKVWKDNNIEKFKLSKYFA